MPTKRTSPTERQLAALVDLDVDGLLPHACAAMHALNRRAKEKRDRRNDYRRASFARAISDEIEAIYSLKDRFLEALVSSGRGSVERFTRERTHYERPEWHCPECGRDFVSVDGECYRCGIEAEQVVEGGASSEEETWYVVAFGGYRWHQPGDTAASAVRAAAVPGENHDPDQPQREIPNVGMTIKAQIRTVELAIERLRGVPLRAIQ